jgi:hypothetical protein
MVSRTVRVSRGRPERCGTVWRPAGLRILVPGYAQWSWRQRERALVLFGSFLASLGVGVFAWGTRASLLILMFAFGTHVVSAADVIRQSAFPGFGRLVPMVSASAGLGFGCYAPAVALAMVFAWPGYGGERASDGYLINRGAYWSSPPATGETAWARLPGWSDARPVRVLAGPGQRVEWSDSGLRVEGEGVTWEPPREGWRLRELAFTVPQGRALVATAETSGRHEAKTTTSCGLAVVETRWLQGRAWARLYPIWDRGLIR